MIKMLSNNVMIEPYVEKEETSQLGIVLSTNAKQYNKGTVVATGPGTYLEDGTFVETSVEVGDVVYYLKNQKTFFEYKGKNLLVLNEENIFGYERSVNE